MSYVALIFLLVFDIGLIWFDLNVHADKDERIKKLKEEVVLLTTECKELRNMGAPLK